MKHISNLINIIILFTPCILMSFAAAKKSVVLGVISIIFVFFVRFSCTDFKEKRKFLDVCYFNNNAAPRQHKNRRARILLHIRIKNFIGFSGDFAVFPFSRHGADFIGIYNKSNQTQSKRN